MNQERPLHIPSVINEINLMRAHANESLKIADRLTQRLGLATVSTPATSRVKKGLSNEQAARFLAKKNLRKPSNTIAKTYLNPLV